MGLRRISKNETYNMPYTVQIIESDGEAALPIPCELIQQHYLQDGDQMGVIIENGTVVLRPIRTH